MTISAKQVKELREMTGVGLMECKKALTENGGDIEKSILWLRERGLSRAAKKAGRVTAEGNVAIHINESATAGAMVEVNCETDFVSKNKDFTEFCQKVAEIALKNNATTIAELENCPYEGTETVSAKLTALISTIGENLNLRRISHLNISDGVVAGYSHMGGKIGSIVGLSGSSSSKTKELAKDLAMHVAAAAPRYLHSDEVNEQEIAQEKDLAKKKLKEQNKPENMWDKILIGQIQKFYKEICLLNQPFVKDTALSIEKLVKQQGDGAVLTHFARFQLGEGIEKTEENFAEEVAAQLK